MAKIGDTVRFLNSTGGGKITRIEGKVAYVDDDGFETPVLLKEVVVVLPAGHEPAQKGSRLMFDQAAFDEGKKPAPTPAPAPKPKEAELPKPQPAVFVEETAHGDRLNIALAFEPTNLQSLDKSRFTAVIVNDSNYQLEFTFLRRGADERGWTVVNGGTIPPNELLDITTLSHEDLPSYERVAFQCIAFKKDKTFTLQAPVSVMRRLDLTKFHKYHCFRPGLYFENGVIEIPLVTDGVAVKPLEVNSVALASAMKGDKPEKDAAAELSKKFRVDKGKKGRTAPPADNPHKLLPLIEVDLHIGELTDTIAGMEPKDMLEMQLAEVRKVMEANRQRKGQKIVFIHGKGEGVLRKAVLELLRKEYPKAEIQDASFREYGFGASLITIN
ncbi:MAG: DUF2027 domain-containing protein [Muribaculaceae bacterium]|nr:DUF2027 domain-containing protein [Muribaculaceae bacterium]MDE6299316.1 DUF2027 domain-containing protein [Muribaculaceae bacterium]